MRRIWFQEQIAQTPEPSDFAQGRTQLGVSALTYSEAMSTKAWAVLDLKLVEISVAGGTRVFYPVSSEGQGLATALGAEAKHAMVEIARYRVSPNGVYGRLGASYLSFLPGGAPLWRFSLSTGVRPSPEIPYELRLSAAALLSFSQGKQDYFVFTGEASRVFQLGGKWLLQLGGLFTWGHLLRAVNDSVEREFILFSLGPQAGLKTPIGKLAFGVPMRVWIDKTVSGGYLSQFSTPSFSLSWQTLF